MTNKDTSVTPPSIDTLKKRAITGAAIGMGFTLLFILTADNADPSWSKYWFIKPLLLTPFVTALGGTCFFYLEQIFFYNGWKKSIAMAIGVVGFIISLWLGMVLGFNGTYWN